MESKAKYLSSLINRFKRRAASPEGAMNQALDQWLGMPSAKTKPSDDIPWQVFLKTKDKLGEQEKSAIWSKITSRRQAVSQPETAPAKILSLQTQARKWLFSAPAMAFAALVLIAILYKPAFRYYEKESDRLVMSFKSPQTNQKLGYPDRDISIQAYVQGPAVLEKADLTQSLTFWMRGIDGLTASRTELAADEKPLLIGFLSGDLLINFHPAQDRGNVFRKIQVRDREITFEIIGTEFIVSKTKDRTWLLVNEGKVMTTVSGSSFVVEAGGLWTGPNGKLHRLPGDRIKKFFADFKNGSIRDVNLDLLARLSETKSDLKIVNDSRVILHSGQIVAGKIVFSDERKIIVRTKLTGSFEILRTDIKEIVEMPFNK